MARPTTPFPQAARRIIAVALLGAVAAVAATGCGSSKPDYCDQREDFVTSINSLADVNVISQGTDGLTKRIDEVQASAKKLIDAAKSDFPDQTKALEDSLNALSASLKALKDPSTRTAALTQLPAQATAVDTAAQNLDKAVRDKCD
jgi:hypothetical protein